MESILFMLARPAAGGEIYNVVTLNAPLARILDAIRKHVPGQGCSGYDHFDWV